MKISTVFLTTHFVILALFTRICGFISVSMPDPTGLPLHMSVHNRLVHFSEELEIPRENILECNFSVEAPQLKSVQDTCRIRDDTTTHSSDVTRSDDVISKGDHCAQYYDYLSTSQEFYWDPHLRECSHPQLFDEKTMSCRHYSLVDCRHRFEPKDACDYMRHQCHGIHCIPCHFRYPSCRGQPDGLNAWPWKLYTPYFVMCVDERVVHRGKCDFPHRLHIFDPLGKACVPAEFIHNIP